METIRGKAGKHVLQCGWSSGDVVGSEVCYWKWSRLYWQPASLFSSFAFLVFMCFFLSSSIDAKNVTQGQEKHRETYTKKEERAEGRRENHILDRGQVVCGTECETEMGERGEECEGEGGRKRGGGINGRRGREKMRKGLMERGREGMSLRAEPLETA